MAHDSIHALWVDPLAFDPNENGAPYLPEGQNLKTASGSVLGSLLLRMPQGVRAPELGVLVGVLRAGSLVHQSHHWQTKGASSFGDHLLYERLYGESQGLVDQVAERAVGMGGEALVDPVLQATLLPGLTSLWCRYIEPNPDGLAMVSLEVERCILDCVGEVRSRMSDVGALSPGTDNMLQGVADKHEEFVYLLQQRVQVTYSYDSR